MSKDGPFNTALQEFLSSLNPEERKALESSSCTLEDVLAGVQQREKNRLEKIIKDFEAFFAAIEVGIGDVSPLVGVVYGSLQAILELVNKEIKFFDAVVDTLESMSVHLPFYHDYATTLYTQSSTTQGALAEVYIGIFAVYSALLRAFNKSEDLMFRPFQNELDTIVERLAKQQEIVENEARARDEFDTEGTEQGIERTKHLEQCQKPEHDRYEIRRERKSAKDKEQQAAKRSQFMKLLNPVDCFEKHFKSLKVHTQPGCWLLEHTQFKEWYDRSNGLLWCHSKPGAGKTVLMSVVIDHIIKGNKDNSGVAVAYFYCEGDGRRKKGTIVVLASLLAQLMNHGDVSSPQKYALIKEHHSTKSIDTLDLVSLLIKVLQDFQKAYIVVDALDECESDQQQTLCAALKTLSGSCNLIVTSRRDKEHLISIFTHVSQIAIQPDDVRADISHFVTNQVEQNKKLSKKSAALKTDIVDALVDGSDGMFLWVKLQLDHICTRRTDRDIRNALKELPRGLHETYARALEKIQSSQLSLRVLLWVLHASQPLTLEQLAEAVAIEDMENDQWDTSRIIDEPSSLIFCCENLVTCSEQQTLGSWATATDKVTLVQFIHTSVADFLRESPIVMAPDSPFYPLENVHMTLAVDCLKYLYMRTKQDPEFYQKIRQSESKTAPFATYANTAWEQHLRTLKTVDEDIVQLFRDFMAIPEVLKEYGGGSSLHVALFLDLPLIADVLVESEGLDLWSLDETKHTLLHRAALGNLKVLKRVVEKMSRSDSSSGSTREPGEEKDVVTESSTGETQQDITEDNSLNDKVELTANETEVDEEKEPEKTLAGYINLPDVTLSTALHYAAYSGVFEAVELLVEKGADLKARDNRQTTPLHWAAASTKIEACQSLTFLLERGSEIEAKDYNNGTALHWAADHDKLEILLEHKANVNAAGLTDLTALHLAAKKGSLESCKLLIDRGANTNALDTHKKSALHYATAQFGTSKIVALLLENAADVDLKDEDDNTALHFAASYDIETVKLLAEAGGKVNVFNNKKRTPLHNAAFEYSNQEILKYLIEADADLEAKDENDRTALHDAASTDFDNSKVLIEAGANCKALDKSLCAPQHFAASIPAGLNTLKLLSEKGADLHLIDSRDWNVLHIAASTGGFLMVEYLVNEVGLDVRLADDQAATPLHYAVYSGLLESVRLLIEKGADIMVIDGTKKTPLHWACQKNGAQDVVQSLIDQGANINATDDRKMTPLHLAAQAGSFESVEVLLRAGADVTAEDNQKCTALHLASRKPEFGGPQCVKVLLEHSCNTVDEVDSLGNTALHFAGVFSGLETVKLFKKHGANLFATNKQGASVLHWAAGSLTFGSEAVIEFLLDEGCSLTELDKQNWAPLHWAAMFGSTADIKVLLDRGAEVDVVNKQQNTPLHLATIRGSTNTTGPFESVQLLLEKGADPNRKGEDDQTPLHFAVKHCGSFAIVELLVKHGADINLLDAFHSTALHQAAANDPASAKFLVERGAEINVYDTAKRSPLHHAKFHETIQLLVEKGADINAMDKQQSTVLHWTADRAGTHESVKYLVEHGAKTDLIDQFGCTPLHLAAYGGEPESVSYLAEHGGDLEMQDQHQCTPLFLAAKNPSGFEAMKILVKMGAKLSLVDENQSSPLHWTICHERLEPVKFIVENGADINVCDQSGVTPLHVASTRSNLHDIAKFLVENGSDIHAADDEGSAVIHYAAYSFEAHDTLKFLIEKGCGEDVDLRDTHGSTPVHLASRSPRGRPSLEILLQHGGQVNVQDKNLCTPLHWAAFYCDHKLVEVLLKAGSNVNTPDIQKCTPLHLAYSKPRIFKLLLEHGADVTALDDKSQTPVHYALHYDLFDVKKMLQELNIPFDFPESKCDVALIWAPSFSVVAPLPSPSTSVAQSDADPDDIDRNKSHPYSDTTNDRSADSNHTENQNIRINSRTAVAAELHPVETGINEHQVETEKEALDGTELSQSQPSSPSTGQKTQTESSLNITHADTDLPRTPLHYANFYWHGVTHRQFEVRPKTVDDEDPVIIHTPLSTITERTEDDDQNAGVEGGGT